MDLGKIPEKEPVVCHFTDQLRHDKHGTQKAGREYGDIVWTQRGRTDLGFCPLVYAGCCVLPSCLSVPMKRLSENLTVDWEKL